jgi:phosphoglycolate phosphatase-like HAD superfamily hydrolase
MRLFLFDVDGTLLWAHGAGRIALTRAIRETYHAPVEFDRYDFRGKTDPRIVLDLVGAAGLPEEAIRARLDACFAAYARRLDALIEDGHPVQTMPGIPELVRALGARADCLLGLLTGNVEAGARAKLRPTGLLPHFRLGAFGSDSADRRRLPAIARQRARDLTGHDFPFQDILIIGDTPLDVDCARACGARSVAVATGQHSYDELAACAPDLLFADFAETDVVLRALTQGLGGPAETGPDGCSGADGIG